MRSCCALYVDAGYLLASAATRVTGTSLRGGVRVDHAELVPRLIAQAEKDSRLPLLRLNWYDSGGEAGGQPDAVQARLGLTPRVKLRLGRLSYAGEQKGVDLRLGLDLVTHARNRTIDIAYLLSGDDDLTEAVEEAQGHGVQVILLAVPDDEGKPYGVARHLQRESDGLLLIDEATVRESVRSAGPQSPPAPAGAEVLPGSALVPSEAGPPASNSAGGDVGDARSAPTRPGGPGVTGPSPASAPAATAPTTSPGQQTPGAAKVPTPSPAMFGAARAAHPPPPASLRAATRLENDAIVVYSTTTGRPSEPPAMSHARVADDGLVDEVCRRVLGTWLQSVTDKDRTHLFANRPSIPPDIDRALLQDLSARLGFYDIFEQDRFALRAAFWARAEQMVDQPDDPGEEAPAMSPGGRPPGLPG